VSHLQTPQFQGTVLPSAVGMAKASYLARLPRVAQKRGDQSKGEIEIVTRKKSVRRIDAECGPDLEGSALGKNGKRIGILLEDKVHFIVRDAVEFPSGAAGCAMRIIGKTQFDGVNGVIALTHCEGRLFLRKIFRHATRSWELEAVRGRRETGMTSRGTVRKEVKEELGYPVKRTVKLGSIRPETALLATEVDVFWTELGRGPRKDDPEPKEAFGPVVELSFGEVGERIMSGEIRDGCTISALMLAQLAGVMQPILNAATASPQPKEPKEPGEPGEPGESGESGESGEPSEPSEPRESREPNELTRPMESMEPIESMESTESIASPTIIPR
jgi:ADP-ribose pyrophosphatase